MTSKIKILGLSLIAIVATSALAASAAQAGSFDIGASPAVLTGHSELGTGQVHVMTLTRTDGTKFDANCTTASSEGTTTGQAIDELTLTPTYGSSEAAPTGCTLFGQNAQVKVNGCKYTITGTGQAARTALLDIVGCTSLTPYIQFKSAICEVRIPEQNGVGKNGLSHLVSLNLAGGKEITLETTISGITVHQIGGSCPDKDGHKSTNGSLVGNTILKVFKPSSASQVTKHGHQYVETKCGEQVTLVAT